MIDTEHNTTTATNSVSTLRSGYFLVVTVPSITSTERGFGSNKKED